MAYRKPKHQSKSDDNGRSMADEWHHFITLLARERQRLAQGAHPDSDLSILAASSEELRNKWYCAIRKEFRRLVVWRLIASIPAAIFLSALGTAIFL